MDSEEKLPHLPNQFPGIGALYQLVQSLSTSDNLPDLLQAVVDRTCAALNASWVVLVTFDVAKHHILDCVQSGPDANPELNLSFKTLGNIARTYLWPMRHSTPFSRGCLLLNEEARVFGAQFERDFNSAIVAPLLQRDEMIGLLMVARSTDRPVFTDSDVALISVVASQAAAALENFRLLASLNQEKTQLELLYRLGQHLSSSLDIRMVCQLALDEICKVFADSYGLLFIVDAKTDAIQLMAQVGFDDDILRFVMGRFQAGEGVTGWVVRHRQMAVIDDVETEPRWIMTREADSPRSGISVPLLSGEDLIGAITLSALAGLSSRPNIAGCWSRQRRPSPSPFSTRSCLATYNSTPESKSISAKSRAR